MTNTILKLIEEINPYEDITEKTNLIEDGILDSLTLVILIDQIEAEFGIQIPEDMLQPVYFDSVEKIVALVKTLQKSEQQEA